MVSPSPHPSDPQYHVLLVKDLVGQRAVILEAATYSLGRDPTNGIQLHSDSVSRQHALLLRVPNSAGQGGYHYRVMDGNSDGKRSANGVKVNDQRCESHDLTDGDQIELSATVSLIYRIVSALSDVGITTQQLESAGYRSIKSAAIEHSGTLLMDDTNSGTIPLSTRPPSRQNTPIKPTVEDRLPDSFFDDISEDPDPDLRTSSRHGGSALKLWIPIGAGLGGALLVLLIVLLISR